MAISLRCTVCGKSAQVRDEFAGRRIRCPGCQAVIVAPGATKSPPVERPGSVPAPPPLPVKPAAAPVVRVAERKPDRTTADGSPGRRMRSNAIVVCVVSALVALLLLIPVVAPKTYQERSTTADLVSRAMSDDGRAPSRHPGAGGSSTSRQTLKAPPLIIAGVLSALWMAVAGLAFLPRRWVFVTQLVIGYVCLAAFTAAAFVLMREAESVLDRYGFIFANVLILFSFAALVFVHRGKSLLRGASARHHQRSLFAAAYSRIFFALPVLVLASEALVISLQTSKKTGFGLLITKFDQGREVSRTFVKKYWEEESRLVDGKMRKTVIRDEFPLLGLAVSRRIFLPISLGLFAAAAILLLRPWDWRRRNAG